MELMIRERDYVSDGAGGLARVSGGEETLLRALYKLSVPRGSFALAPEIGSRLHLLWREKPASRAAAAKQYIAEALAEETDMTVESASVREGNGVLEVETVLRCGGEETALHVTIGGE